MKRDLFGNREKSLLFAGLVILFSFLELAMLTFWRNKPGVYISPLIWMLAGIGTCLAALYFCRRKEAPAYGEPGEGDRKTLRPLIIFGIFLAGALYNSFLLDKIFTKIPVDPAISDIVPSLQEYVRRWLAGENVYAPIHYDGWQVVPTYPPFLWMPYSVPEVLNFDYRWMAYFVFLLGLSFYYFRLARKPAPMVETVVKALFPFVFLYVLFTDKSSDLFGMSVELMPVGLYLILGLTLFHRSWWIVTMGVLLCLLSRWAFTFWLPVYLLVFWIERGFGEALKVGVSLGLGVALIFVIPFVIPNWQTLYEEMKIYPRTAPGRWHTEYWQPEGAKPYHLKQGLSYAIFFYDFVDGEVEDRLQLNRRAHKIASAFAALLILLGYFLLRKREIDLSFYFLIALKFYLVIFYGFFYVPFLYLYQLPLLLSVPLVMRVSGGSKWDV